MTLPIACIFVYWAWMTTERFYTFGLRYNPAPIPYHLHDTGVKEIYSLFRKLELALFSTWAVHDNKPEDLEIINLFVPSSELAKLNSNLPHSGYEYVEGGIWNEGKLQKIKFKYRGDFVYHWGNKKKSLRVKTKKKKLFDGVRTFNLIGTKQFGTHFGYMLAKKMGLIAPRSNLVEVTLNGKMLGMHVYVEQLEELTLRNNGRMPGDLYAGELIAKDSYRGAGSQIFDHPNLWKKIAINNHYPEESRKPLEKLIALVANQDTEKAHIELSKLLDMDAWGRFAAFETLSQSFHYDNAHNWRLYYDPMKSLFYPVVWDPAGWNTGWFPKNGEKFQLDVIPSSLHQMLFKNSDFLRMRAKAINDFYMTGKDKAFLKQIDQALPGLERAIARDPLIAQTPSAVLSKIYFLRDSIEKVFADIKQGYLGSYDPINYSIVKKNKSEILVKLTVSGRLPNSNLRMMFSNIIDNPITGHLSYQVGGKKVVVDISGAIFISGSLVEIKKDLVSKQQQITVGDHPLKKRRLKIDAAYYELTLKGIDALNNLTDISYLNGNGEIKYAEFLNDIVETSFDEQYNIVDAKPAEVPLKWRGVINIDDIKEVNRPLIIEPGTTVRFSPGSSLLIRNRLLAEGTKEKPIFFTSMENGQEPWGTVALISKNANNSRLNYVEFVGGSGLKGDLLEYTAMFSIHDVKDVVIENATFRDSKITDDMVHVVYSDVHFRDCRFERSLMDALDIDISNAVIERCIFIDSGNDSIDLMTSNAVVLDTVIENSGDKAASVGEGSHLLAINNIFRNNAIGVQAKDGSVASLYNIDLIGNKHALDAYKKNWRYNDGGDIFVYKSHIGKNGKLLTAGKKSNIRVFDSYIEKSIEINKKRIELDHTVDSDSKRTAMTSKLERYKKDIMSMKNSNNKYMERIDSSFRGARN